MPDARVAQVNVSRVVQQVQRLGDRDLFGDVVAGVVGQLEAGTALDQLEIDLEEAERAAVTADEDADKLDDTLGRAAESLAREGLDVPERPEAPEAQAKTASIRVRLSPKAQKGLVVGWMDDGALNVKVLAAPEAGYVNGAVLTVDGGWTAGYARDF